MILSIDRNPSDDGRHHIDGVFQLTDIPHKQHRKQDQHRPDPEPPPVIDPKNQPVYPGREALQKQQRPVSLFPAKQSVVQLGGHGNQSNPKQQDDPEEIIERKADRLDGSGNQDHKKGQTHPGVVHPVPKEPIGKDNHGPQQGQQGSAAQGKPGEVGIPGIEDTDAKLDNLTSEHSQNHRAAAAQQQKPLGDGKPIGNIEEKKQNGYFVKGHGQQNGQQEGEQPPLRNEPVGPGQDCHGHELPPEDDGVEIHPQGDKGHQGHHGVFCFLLKAAAEGQQNHDPKHQQKNAVADEYPLQYPAQQHIADFKLMNQHLPEGQGRDDGPLEHIFLHIHADAEVLGHKQENQKAAGPVVNQPLLLPGLREFAAKEKGKHNKINPVKSVHSVSFREVFPGHPWVPGYKQTAPGWQIQYRWAICCVASAVPSLAVMKFSGEWPITVKTRTGTSAGRERRNRQSTGRSGDGQSPCSDRSERSFSRS